MDRSRRRWLARRLLALAAGLALCAPAPAADRQQNDRDASRAAPKKWNSLPASSSSSSKFN